MREKNAAKFVLLAMIIAGLVVLFGDWDKGQKPEEIAGNVEMSPVETKKARAEYFHRLLQDPETGRIPDNIRAREMEYSRTLPARNGGSIRMKSASDDFSQQSLSLTWQSAGPENLGGRTRALAFDQRSSDIIIAGGVSGGIWKSKDGGSSWQMKTDPAQNMSVTSLAQDPTSPDTWYYTSGEYDGNSASDRGQTSFYYGTGIFKSTDNGETWFRLSATKDTDTGFNSQYDYVSRVKVSSATGSIFIASNAFGLFRSTDDGSSFSLVKGGANDHAWTDFDIDSKGNIIAVFSSYSFDSDGNPGVFYSTDDGATWTEVTPSGFPTDHSRSVIAFAPSNPDIAYVLSEKTQSSTNQSVSFFKLNMADNTSEDRSANIPDFGDPVGGMNLQGGYNMVVSVKPDDPDFVMVGGTNLFRSRDGFATQPDGGYDNSDTQQKEEYWIGGYARSNNVYQYPSQHPDQHVVTWDPNDPSTAWVGHDGGLSSTSDITAAPVSWADMDNGYVTGQFYTVAIPPEKDDDRIMGGTQDNGTPFYRINDTNQQATSILDVSSGDGAYAHWGSNYAYVSSQNGKITRIKIESDGSLTSPYDNATSTDWSDVYPSGANNQLFVHPYAVDPNDEGIMYYPGGREMWRNTTVDEIPSYNNGGTTDGWGSFTAVSGSGYTITAVEISDAQPSGRLYYGASDAGNYGSVPKLYKLDNATTSTDTVNISISNTSYDLSGAYVHDIAINPNNGDEALVVMSNYNIVGLFHTTDGGQSWTAIEGNLEGDSSNPGPSIRNATILPTGSGTVYFVGTSTGVYSTSNLDGMNTSWSRESAQGIGYSVSEYITSRHSDGKVAVGTHGRGIFLADVSVNQTGDGKVPAAPSNVVASMNGTDHELSWDANSESDISKYYIYRGIDSNALTKYDSVSASTQSFTDSSPGNGTFYYAVSAYDVENKESNKSAKVAIFNQTLSIGKSWQMIGSPLAASTSAGSSDLLLYGFSSVYGDATSLKSQTGYWAKGYATIYITLAGSAKTSSTLSLSKGWNLISGIVDTIGISAIEDPNGILSNADTYSYQNGAYSSVSDIAPGKGYWIHAKQAGDISMNIQNISAKQESYTKEMDGDRLTFRSGNRKQTFFVTEKEINPQTRNKYRMPPVAPEPALDIRTRDGFRLAGPGQQEIRIKGEEYPLELFLESQASGSFRLQGITGRDTTSYMIHPNNKVEIPNAENKWVLESLSAEEQISEHKLHPGYPNPFNPTTNIRYQLASEVDVKIEVFDILGRQVATLVNEQKRAGMHKVRFDASGLSSGLYFVKIKAGGYTDVQKLTLIK